MNERQKLVQQQFLDNEETVIKRLKQVYSQSLKDIEGKAKALQDDIERLDTLSRLSVNAEEKQQILSQKQSKVYQKQYQDALKKQIGSILDNMQVEEFRTISDYLQVCYEDGFVGAIYDLQGQGIPLCFPLNQEQMVQAVQTDSKISGTLYSRLGEDVAELKKGITAEISRGISTGASYAMVAQQIKARMVGNYDKKSGGALYRATTIARTEGHRIQCQAAMNASYEARDMGAKVVKQWDATLDGRTRPSHQRVDGEFRELDEPFSNGLMLPGDPNGSAAEVVNCRCAYHQRARWAIEGGFTKRDDFTGEIREFASPEDYAEFKKWYFSKENTDYMKYVTKLQDRHKTKDYNKLLGSMTDAEYAHFKTLEAASPMFKQSIHIYSPGSPASFRRSLREIADGKAGLDKRRQNIVNRLRNEGDSHRYEVDTISTRDLAYLSASEGVEFALFRSKRNDILIRGNARDCNISGDLAEEIIEHGYEWVAHSHVDGGVLTASVADRETLKKLKQKTSKLIGIDGKEIEFSQSMFDDL